MRLVTFTLAFFVFGAVFVTPIKVAHHNNAITKRSGQDKLSTSKAMQKRSSSSFGSSLSNSMRTAGGTIQVIRKRHGADEDPFIAALKSIQINDPLRHETLGTVYPLAEQIGDKHAVVKIIDMRTRSSKMVNKVKQQRDNIFNAEHLLSCGRTEDAKFYYLIMPYPMGLPFSRCSGLPPEKAEEVVANVISWYKEQRGINIADDSLDCCVFWYVDGHGWMGEIVNWESAIRVTSGKGVDKPWKTSPVPFEIPNYAGIFRPDLQHNYY